MNNITIKSIKAITVTYVAASGICDSGMYVHDAQRVWINDHEKTGRVLVGHFGI